MIIGLTGSMGCGKGEVVKILQNLGFRYITLSSIVKEEAKKRGVFEEREQLMDIGNELRKKEGAGVLAKRVLGKITASGYEKWVIDGIRNPAEIEALRKVENVFIIGISVNQELLIERIFGRGRSGDSKAREEIVRKIEREWGKGELASGQQVGKCMDMADVIVSNDGAIKELGEKVISYYNRVTQ